MKRDIYRKGGSSSRLRICVHTRRAEEYAESQHIPPACEDCDCVQECRDAGYCMKEDECKE